MAKDSIVPMRASEKKKRSPRANAVPYPMYIRLRYFSTLFVRESEKCKYPTGINVEKNKNEGTYI